MSIATRGYGTSGTIAEIVTRGFAQDQDALVQAGIVTRGFGASGTIDDIVTRGFAHSQAVIVGNIDLAFNKLHAMTSSNELNTETSFKALHTILGIKKV